jgi:histidinol-phosphate/aromatic aminotransferase/cobyric acid decarboxylase-like protein/GNAT superfamily N-acetyltransferase
MRHAVYATELGQHHEDPGGRLTDELDAFNQYLVATDEDRLIGFVSITPPGFGRYSIDKYVDRSELPFPVDDGCFEVRILTVDPAHRGGPTAAILMYGALRWVEHHGATRIVIIGRREVASLYERVGLRPLGRTIRSGAVTFELMAGTIEEIQAGLPSFATLLARLRGDILWDLGIPFRSAAGSFHGGASHVALGTVPTPDARARIITADVLDAWFPPAPGVIEALTDEPAFLAGASPPTHAVELQEAIAAARGVRPASVLPGPGLSALIFTALPTWLSPGARVLLAEPQYGEYRHVVEHLLGADVDRIELRPSSDGTVDPGELRARAADGYDLVVLVEPNNPLGCRFRPGALAAVLAAIPDATIAWVDETYVDLADPSASLEAAAAAGPNLVVGKSMSKAYALSGLRVGYLCGPPALLEPVRQRTPPWWISRPAQAAAMAALEDPGYYAARHRETAVLREELSEALAALPGVSPLPGTANFVLCELSHGIDAPILVEHCRREGLFLRTFPTDPTLRWRFVRIAVKDRSTNRRIVQTIERVLAAERRVVSPGPDLAAALPSGDAGC